MPLFRKRCEERGVRPEHIKTLADIKLLPFSKKIDLRDEYPMGLRGAPMDEIVRFHCSSGTTGKPICIPNTMQDIEVWKNGAMRCLTTAARDSAAPCCPSPAATPNARSCSCATSA